MSTYWFFFQNVNKRKLSVYLLTICFTEFAFISAEEEFAIKKLDGNDSENELEEDIYNEDIYNIFKGINNTVKYCFQFWNTFNCF